MTVFIPKYIEARLYKTPLQRLRDFLREYSETIAWTIAVSLFFSFMILNWMRTDKAFNTNYPKWEVLNQRTGDIGTGSMILNANYKPQ